MILPNSVLSIDDQAFSSCLSPTNVPLPASLTTLGADVFRNCKIVEAVIPASVTSIGYKPYPHAETYNVSPDNSHFSSLSGILYTRDQQTLIDCPSRNPLSSLTIGPNVRTISDNAFSPSRLETIAIPDNVTNVGTGILAWCGLLKNVTLGAGMGEIPARMFQSSGLESITLPANITVTGAGAFRNCGSLEIVRLLPESTCQTMSPLWGTGFSVVAMISE